jgi:outer membrane receptor protein involved in Fe transport
MAPLARPGSAMADAAAGPGEAPGAGDLTRMSLTELANIEVSSVSKTSEALQRAPASIYVITQEDILRSAATNIPEVLRLAPNLLVTQTTSSSYIISAPGLGGNPTAQNFSNKLLILIDGRSVYTPLFSGIYANTLDVMLEDVDRIEVISGVGATLWGANAMNGVINIITRASYLTQGSFLGAAAGNQVQAADARYGGRINGDATFRVYGFGFHRGAMEEADGSTAMTAGRRARVGFAPIGRPIATPSRCDFRLPGAVAREIRRESWGGDVLLLAITGWGQREDKERASAAGFDHHLTKPVDADQVEKLLRGFCDSRRTA